MTIMSKLFGVEWVWRYLGLLVVRHRGTEVTRMTMATPAERFQQHVTR